MITAFTGKETSPNWQLSDDEWKWNGYGTPFHPSAEGFLWSRGCFCRAGCWGHLEYVDEGEGISDLFAVHAVFSYPGQVAFFVCLFFILVAGKKYDGEMSLQDLEVYFCVVILLAQPCPVAVEEPRNLSVQNSLSATQWAHYFNILDIYDLLTFPVVQLPSWRYFRNALPGIPKEMYSPVILNNVFLGVFCLFVCFLKKFGFFWWVPFY